MVIETTYRAQIGHSVTLQWYHNGGALVDGTFGSVVISGSNPTVTITENETTATLTIENATAEYSGTYYAIIRDNSVADCEIATNPLSVTLCALEISLQPIDVETDEGSDVQLTTNYTGNVGTVTVQWYKDGIALVNGATGSGSTISGATSLTLGIANAQPSDSGEYYAVLADDGVEGCVVMTSTADVAIGPACLLEIVDQPVGGEFTVGEEIVMTVTHSGEVGTVTFQWYFNGSPLSDGPLGDATVSGATTDTLTITNAQEAQSGSFTVRLTDDGVADCVVQSTVAEVEVSITYPVDIAPTICGAYSFARKLKSDYAGPLFRVRRSSDNAFTDIGLDGDVTDIAALTAFVGAGDGFVASLYDQSSCLEHLSALTANRQMRVVIGGVAQVDANGHLQAVGDGSNDSVSGSSSKSFPTYFCVFKVSTHVDGDVVVMGSQANFSAVLLTGGNKLGLNNGLGAVAGPDYLTNRQNLVIAYFDSADSDTIQLNNEAPMTLDAGDAGSGGFVSLGNNVIPTSMDGAWSELFVINGPVVDPELTELMDNINDFYQLW